MKKPTIISVCTAKGGVGKTTTTVALSEFLASKGYKVLVIDADYQTNCTVALIGNQAWDKLNAQDKTIAALLEDAINEGQPGYARKFDSSCIFKNAIILSLSTFFLMFLAGSNACLFTSAISSDTGSCWPYLSHKRFSAAAATRSTF